MQRCEECGVLSDDRKYGYRNVPNAQAAIAAHPISSPYAMTPNLYGVAGIKAGALAHPASLAEAESRLRGSKHSAERHRK